MSDYHSRMVNIPCPLTSDHGRWDYKFGHRAARQAAAVIALEADAEIASLRAEVGRLKDSMDDAYEERNRLVALLAVMFPSGRKITDIPGWDPEWHGAVYIDFPWGQASWHFHDSQAHLFSYLPVYQGEWDGHTTEDKYAAIAAATGRLAVA